MKIVITQRLDSNNHDRSMEICTVEATKEQFEALKTLKQVEDFVNKNSSEYLENDMITVVNLCEVDEDGDFELIDSKDFDSDVIIKDGAYLVLIPHQSSPQIIAITDDISLSELNGYYLMYDKSSAPIFDNYEALEHFGRGYNGHQSREVLKEFNEI
jgi:hypothetical protein